MIRIRMVTISFFVLMATTSTVLAGETLDLRGVESLQDESVMKRDGSLLTIVVDDDACSEVLIPRLCASLRRITWQGAGDIAAPTLHPETEHWVIRWKKRPPSSKAIELLFDTSPCLEKQLEPITQRGDGRLDLHAYQATTTGEKLRFEPQPHKNTVGYWVNPEDFATWAIQVERPGKFNVGILQGCGRGQGGSEASLSVREDSSVVDRLTFTVEETGHFQNFVWRTVGVLEIPKPGSFTVRLEPEAIKKNALMDVRQLQFVRLP